MRLVDIYKTRQGHDIATFLYELLKERTPEQSISHTAMPSFDEHVNFILSRPYYSWEIIEVDDMWVGAVYITRNKEIGIFILREFSGLGIGQRAIRKKLDEHGALYANINPANTRSRRVFEKLGSELIQVTYKVTA